jgi:acetylornithine/succinyldiaminopimelate/putrescine aminotransferase
LSCQSNQEIVLAFCFALSGVFANILDVNLTFIVCSFDAFCRVILLVLRSRYKLTIDSGKGCFLKTTDGKSYLDFVSGIATCALGHNNEFLTKAIENQMKKVHHVSNLYFIPEQAALANWLCENSGADKAFFCNSGAEANEAAIKLARRNAYNKGITVRFGCS